MRCEECGCETDDAHEWRAYIAADPDEDDADPAVALYCATCAEREFGVPRLASN